MSENNVVSRYTTAARINHWITAVSLILLALSGMALFHPSLYFLTNLFGGGQMTRAVHPWIGVVLFLASSACSSGSSRSTFGTATTRCG